MGKERNEVDELRTLLEKGLTVILAYNAAGTFTAWAVPRNSCGAALVKHVAQGGWPQEQNMATGSSPSQALCELVKTPVESLKVEGVAKAAYR